MKIKGKKGFKFFSIAIAALIFIISGFTGSEIRQSWPQESGNINIPGLQAKVEVWRDKWGVPHIYAANQHDLFLAQGYVHAQDRFWQMDFWRHVGAGRLAEMFGKSQVAPDKFIRTLNWEGIAKQELAQMGEEMQAILQAYADGVNAYLANRDNRALSLEYATLRLINPGYKVEPWQPVNTLTWGKAMAWDLRKNIDTEIQRANLLQTLTPAQIEQLFPPYAADKPLILPDFKLRKAASNNVSDNLPLLTAIAPYLSPVAEQERSLQDLLGASGSGVGSNSWVVAGSRTATGKPILANDPHLAVQMPSIWYELGLHCTPKNAACPYDVTGFSFAGMVGVIIGHSDRIAWGVTNVEPDVMDLYVEKINPANPTQYEYQGKWEDMQVRTEKIQVAGGQPVEIKVRSTRHGSIISETYKPVQSVSKLPQTSLPANYAIALRWTALEPSNLARSIIKINRAQNWPEFRAALQDFDVPSQNFVYADIDGNIGYQMPGKIPIRQQGDGRYPVPGWDGKSEWLGYVPFEELPSAFNPPQGYIVTANNAIVSKDYPYIISTDWSYGYRAQRIAEAIANSKEPISVASMQQLQMDNKNLNAQTLVPILLKVNLPDKHLAEIRDVLKTWDFQNNKDSNGAAIFEAFWKHLLAATFRDELPQAYWPYGGDRWFEICRQLVNQPNSLWWDNRKTRQVEKRDDIFRLAFRQAVTELEQTLGKDWQQWQWGKLHVTNFRNATLGKSGIKPIENLFNRGAFPTSGSGGIVNATAWDATQSFEVTWLPSMRMVADLSHWENSTAIHTTGQSGHAYHPHYDDMIQLWSEGKFHPMLWGKDAIASQSVRLVLVPSRN